MADGKNVIGNRVKEKFPKAILGAQTFRDEETLIVEKGSIVKVAEFLRDDNELAFDFLSDLCGVDKTSYEDGNSFEVVYHLYSIKRNHRVRLKAQISATAPSIDTVINVWATADWLEREAYDMFGIVFDGHPDLRRILMPESFVGHPLRKDYPLKGRQPESLRAKFGQ